MNKVFGYILGFFASIILAAISILLIMKMTIFNKEYVFKSLEASNYYDKVYDEIEKDMKNSLRSSGLDESVVKNLYKKNDVKNDIRNFVGSIYSGSKYSVFTDEIEKKLNSNIDVYLKSKKIELEDKKALDSYVSNIIDIYSNEVSLYGYFQNYIGKIMKLSNVVDFSIAFGIIILVIIITINKYKFKIHFFGTSLLASSMMVIYLRYFIWDKIDYENILIISNIFSDVLRRILTSISNSFIYLGCLYALLGFGLIFINSWKNKRRGKRRGC